MNYLDIILGILLLYGLVKGFMKGLFVELASLIAIVAAIYGATHFSDYIGNHLAKSVSWEPQYIKLTAFALTFIGILIVVSLPRLVFCSRDWAMDRIDRSHVSKTNR